MIPRRTFVLASVAAVSTAGDFWSDKAAAEWSEKDVQKLLTHSPWSKETTVELHSLAMDSSGMSGRGGRGRGGGMGGGGAAEEGTTGGMGGGGMGGGGGRGGRGGTSDSDAMAGGGGAPPVLKAIVRWESARPIRDAVKKELPKEFADRYVISVAGMQMGRGGRGPREETDGGKSIEDRLKQSAQLRRKNADPIFPSQVLTGSQGQVRYFTFPRGSQPIQASDKEVVFHVSLGPLELKAKFPLKEMIYQGELAL